jgi:CPA1 family monovalent cation:H+ antiporter
MPWPAAIALGALLAPPDAVAALAVMRQVAPPYRVRKVLEGESLLNDASALLIYKLAIGAAAVGSFSLAGAVPTFALVAFVILVVVIAVRLAWVMVYTLAQRRQRPASPDTGVSIPPLSARGGLVIGWSGMRGIVTLAAALALPASFPQRDFIQLTAFAVVLGTLVVQGLTLRPLLALLRLPQDRTVETELGLAREAALKAALATLKGDDTPAARRLWLEFKDALSDARHGRNPRERADNMLRRRMVPASRRAIADLRSTGANGDDAFHIVEEELDWLELSSRPNAGSGLSRHIFV